MLFDAVLDCCADRKFPSDRKVKYKDISDKVSSEGLQVTSALLAHTPRLHGEECNWTTMMTSEVWIYKYVHAKETLPIPFRELAENLWLRKGTRLMPSEDPQICIL